MSIRHSRYISKSTIPYDGRSYNGVKAPSSNRRRLSSELEEGDTEDGDEDRLEIPDESSPDITTVTDGPDDEDETDESIDEEGTAAEESSSEMADRQLSYTSIPSLLSETNSRLVPLGKYSKKSPLPSPALSFESVAMELDEDDDEEDLDEGEESPPEEVEDESSETEDFVNVKVRVEKPPYYARVSDAVKVTVSVQPPSEIDEDIDSYYDEHYNDSSNVYDDENEDGEESYNDDNEVSSMVEEENDDDKSAKSEEEGESEEESVEPSDSDEEESNSDVADTNAYDSSGNKTENYEIVKRMPKMDVKEVYKADENAAVANNLENLLEGTSKKVEQTVEKAVPNESPISQVGKIATNGIAQASEKATSGFDAGKAAFNELGSITGDEINKIIPSEIKSPVSANGLQNALNSGIEKPTTATNGVQSALTGGIEKSTAAAKSGVQNALTSGIEKSAAAAGGVQNALTNGMNKATAGVAAASVIGGLSNQVNHAKDSVISEVGKVLPQGSADKAQGALTTAVQKATPDEIQKAVVDKLQKTMEFKSQEPSMLQKIQQATPALSGALPSVSTVSTEKATSSMPTPSIKSPSKSEPGAIPEHADLPATRVMSTIPHTETSTTLKDKFKTVSTDPNQPQVTKPSTTTGSPKDDDKAAKVEDENGEVDEYLSVYAGSIEPSEDDEDENTKAKQMKGKTFEEIAEVEVAKDKLVEEWKLEVKEGPDDLDENFSTIIEDMLYEIDLEPVEVEVPAKILKTIAEEEASLEEVEPEEPPSIKEGSEEVSPNGSTGSLKSVSKGSPTLSIDSKGSPKISDPASLNSDGSPKDISREGSLEDVLGSNSSLKSQGSPKTGLMGSPKVSPGSTAKGQGSSMMRSVSMVKNVGGLAKGRSRKPEAVSNGVEGSPKSLAGSIKKGGPASPLIKSGSISNGIGGVAKARSGSIANVIDDLAKGKSGSISNGIGGSPKAIPGSIKKAVEGSPKSLAGSIKKGVEGPTLIKSGSISNGIGGLPKARSGSIANVIDDLAKGKSEAIKNGLQGSPKSMPGSIKKGVEGSTLIKSGSISSGIGGLPKARSGSIANVIDDLAKTKSGSVEYGVGGSPKVRSGSISNGLEGPKKVMSESIKIGSGSPSIKTNAEGSPDSKSPKFNSDKSQESIDDENSGSIQSGSERLSNQSSIESKEEEVDLDASAPWNQEIEMEETPPEDDKSDEMPENTRKWKNTTEIASTLSQYLYLIKTETIENNVSEIIPLLTKLLSVSRKVKTEYDLPTLVASLSATRVLCDRLIDVKVERGEKSLKNMDLSWLLRVLCKISADPDSKVKPEASFTLARMVKAAGPELITRPIYFLLVMENESQGGQRGQGSKTKAAALDTLTYALISFPKEDFDDLEEIARWVCLVLFHPQRRLRQSALECISIIGNRLGNSDRAISHFRSLIVREAELHYSRSGSDDSSANRKNPGMGLLRANLGLGIFDVSAISAISSRLRRNILPLPSSGGLIEYGVKIPTGKALINILTKLQERDEEAYDQSSSDNVSVTSVTSRNSLFLDEDKSEAESIRMSDLERTAKEDENPDTKPSKPLSYEYEEDVLDIITPDVAYILAGRGRVNKQEHVLVEENLKQINELLTLNQSSLINKKKKSKSHKKKKHKKKRKKEDKNQEVDDDVEDLTFINHKKLVEDDDIYFTKFA